MSEGPDFRKWAARLASQAGKERDSHEVQRLMSIAEYWKRRADIDDWERDGFRPASEPNPHQRLCKGTVVPFEQGLAIGVPCGMNSPAKASWPWNVSSP
jgi:hypothetical protein